MKSEQKIHVRKFQRTRSSLLLTVPSDIVSSLDLRKGQSALIGESEGKIIIKPTEIKLTRKDLKVDDIDEDMVKNQNPDKPKYDNPLDDPDFNPLDRLEIK